jgi:hypothetical protein
MRTLSTVRSLLHQLLSVHNLAKLGFSFAAAEMVSPPPVVGTNRLMFSKSHAQRTGLVQRRIMGGSCDDA